MSNSSPHENSKIYLKDILIPIITALAVVILNQLFFESNRKTESKIELEIQLLKEQMPILRRILILTNKYEVYRWKQLYVETKINEYYDEKKDKSTIKIVQDFTKPDTIKFNMPSFVYEDQLKSEFISNFEEINSKKQILDRDVYEAFQKVSDFIRIHPLPSENDLKKLSTSDWNNEEKLKKWDELVASLNFITVKKLDQMLLSF